MSETIEWRLVLRDEANAALEANRARLAAMSAEATKAAFGVRAVEDELEGLKAKAIAAAAATANVDTKLTTLQTSAAAATRSVATVSTALSTVPGPAQRAWAALNTVDGKILTLGEQAKALQQKMGPAAAAISGVSSALGQNAGQAGKAVAAVGQLVAAFGAGGPFGLALAAGTIAVNTLSEAWDREIAAQSRALSAQYTGVDKAGSLRRGVEADIAALRRQVNGPESPTEARARVQAEIDDVERQRTSVLAQRNALKVGTDGYDDARARLEGERKILEGVLDRLQLKQGLAGAAAAGSKPKPVGAAAPVSDGDTIEDWKQRAYDRAAAEQKVQERLAAERFSAAIAAAEKRTEAEAAIELKAREEKIELGKKLETDFVNWQIDLAEKAQQERQRVADQDAKMYTTLITSATATIAQGVADGVSGQEDALAKTLAALSQQAGGFVTLKGGELLAAGIASELLVPGNPLGIAQIGGGAALIAAGAAITAGGPAVVQAALGGAKGGGGGGSSGDAARSTGASSSRSSSSSSSTPSTTTINITYGGPTGRVAEDVAKDVLKASQRNDKRGRR
jgi:hypothetical protein